MEEAVHYVLDGHSKVRLKLICLAGYFRFHAGTGFMHESFHKEDPQKFTRKWFAWANTIFGEFLWNVYKQKPYLIS
ncbi:MAG: glycoside hydrolase family 125 protein [Chryseolinea sp.]